MPSVALQLVVVALQTLNGGLQRNNCCALLHEYATKETASDAASGMLLHKRACALQHWQRMVQQALQHTAVDARMAQHMVQHGATRRNTQERVCEFGRVFRLSRCNRHCPTSRVAAVATEEHRIFATLVPTRVAGNHATHSPPPPSLIRAGPLNPKLISS